MSLSTVFGLPLHPLIVHATVVLVPLAALAVLLHGFLPSARHRLGLLTVIASALAVALVPLSVSSGEQLQKIVGDSRLVERHQELADGMLPWTIGLLVVAVLLWIRDRRMASRTIPGDGRPSVRRSLDLLLRPVVLGLLVVVAVVGTGQQVIRVGHSGAQAAWGDVVTANK